MVFLILAFILVEILLVVDLLQTRYIAKNPSKFSELNIVLGPNPSVLVVNVYFAVWLIGMGIAASYGLLAVLLLVSLLEAVTTFRNYKLGIKFA